MFSIRLGSLAPPTHTSSRFSRDRASGSGFQARRESARPARSAGCPRLPREAGGVTSELFYNAGPPHFTSGAAVAIAARATNGSARFAGPVRRCVALLLDFVIVSLIVPFSGGHASNDRDASKAAAAIATASSSHATHVRTAAQLKEMQAEFVAQHLPFGITTSKQWIAAHLSDAAYSRSSAGLGRARDW